MKPALNNFYFSCAIAAVLFLAAVTTANCQTEANIPHIKFTDVPITSAIENFARLSNLNYMIDPKLFAPPVGSNPHGMIEPKLNIDWTDISASNALAAVLKANGMVMVPDEFTTVALITDTNHIANVVDATLLVSTNATAPMTNGVIPQIRFWNVPLDTALKQLIWQGGINVVLDPKVATNAGSAQHKIGILSLASISWGEAPTTVSLRWENITAKQAVVALCEAYDLVIVKDAATSVVSIKPRD